MLRADHFLFHLINQGLANPIFDFLCPIARDKNTWLPIYLLASAAILFKYRWKGLLLIAIALLAITCSDQCSNLIKQLVHRLRPCAVPEPVRLLVSRCSDGFSFTSNHAANHFCIATYLSFCLRQFKWLPAVLYSWAGFIAFSQVYVGLHYPFDVIGGAMLGISIGAAALVLKNKIARLI